MVPMYKLMDEYTSISIADAMCHNKCIYSACYAINYATHIPFMQFVLELCGGALRFPAYNKEARNIDIIDGMINDIKDLFIRCNYADEHVTKICYDGSIVLNDCIIAFFNVGHMHHLRAEEPPKLHMAITSEILNSGMKDALNIDAAVTTPFRIAPTIGLLYDSKNKRALPLPDIGYYIAPEPLGEILFENCSVPYAQQPTGSYLPYRQVYADFDQAQMAYKHHQWGPISTRTSPHYIVRAAYFCGNSSFALNIKNTPMELELTSKSDTFIRCENNITIIILRDGTAVCSIGIAVGFSI